jgi:GTP-binding protein
MQSLPTVVIIGRPNVGKSTLFNCLTRSRDALVAEIAGLTRDRQYGFGQVGGKKYIVIDTGGLIGNTSNSIENMMQEQVKKAIEEATIVLFLVDASAGLTVADEEIAQQIRQSSKPLLLVLNKSDKSNEYEALAEFSQLGFEEIVAISAVHRRGIISLSQQFCQWFAPQKDDEEDIDEDKIRVAIVGRPNAGKSTLVNCLLKEDRVLTSDMPGTTRDSITVDFSLEENAYQLIDTAGLRRKTKVHEKIEKFSAIKTIESIEQSQVSILMIDVIEGINDLDITLAAMIIDIGRALVIALNKWDALDADEKKAFKQEFSRRAEFLDFAQHIPISALRNQGMKPLFGAVQQAYASAFAQIATTDLNRILQSAVEHHSPPMVGGKRAKLRYAHIGGHNPPIIVIHGNSLSKLPRSYKRYLEGVFRRAFDLYGTPIQILFKAGENPFAGHKRSLSTRQQQKKRRLMKFVKNNKTKR